MPGFDLLDVAIGTVLFFLIVSLLCSSLRELLELVLKDRGKDLERGLGELLDDAGQQSLVRSLYQHGVIAALFRGEYDPGRPFNRRLLPSYIPAGHFATALLDIVARGPGTSPYPVPPSAVTVDQLRRQVAYLPSARVQRVVLSAIDYSAGDLNAVKANLEAWYDGTMDRVSGWYKRRTQVWLFAIGFVAAAALNLDALTVMHALMTQKALLASSIQAAERITRSDDGAPRVDPSTNAAPRLASPAEPRPTLAEETLRSEAAETRAAVEMRRDQLEDVGYPVGWNAAGCPTPQMKDPTSAACPGPLSFTWSADHRPLTAKIVNLRFWLWIALGWLVTAIAVCVGAPTWFDVLNKFMVIRSTVKPREKSGEEGSEDRAGGTPPPPSPPPPPPPAPAAGPNAPGAPSPSPLPPEILAPEETMFEAEEWNGYTPAQGPLL